MNRKTVIINSALGAALALLTAGTVGTLTGALGQPDRASADTRTVAVSKGSVAAVATANGSVSAASTTVVNAQNCSGPITAVSVALGQDVGAGQELVSIDPTNAQNALTAATAQLDAAKAQANQQQVTASNQVAAARQSVSSAQQTADLDSAQQAAALAAAQKAVDADNAAVSSAQDNAKADPSNPQYQAALTSAQAQLTKDQQTLAQAQNSQASQQLKDKQQLAGAQNQLASAQNSVGTVSSANVTTAQLAVDTANKNLASCTLTAPVAGTVTAVNVVVGGNAGSGSSGASSGSAGASASSGASGSGTAAAVSSASSSTGLVTISDTKNLQVIANFAEADVASIKVGDSAEFNFPALKQDAGAGPVTGKVTAIGENAATSNNVVSYPVTVSITNPPPTLRLGQSANISVTTATADSALLVPTLAVTTAGNRQTVKVVKNGQTSTVEVKTGISSNGRTEVLSGVAEGDQIELPSIPATVETGGISSGGQGSGRFGGAGGFGGAAGAGAGRG